MLAFPRGKPPYFTHSPVPARLYRPAGKTSTTSVFRCFARRRFKFPLSRPTKLVLCANGYVATEIFSIALGVTNPSLCDVGFLVRGSGSERLTLRRISTRWHGRFRRRVTNSDRAAFLMHARMQIRFARFQTQFCRGMKNGVGSIWREL